jgi:hypothetical protein
LTEHAGCETSVVRARFVRAFLLHSDLFMLHTGLPLFAPFGLFFQTHKGALFRAPLLFVCFFAFVCFKALILFVE